MFKTFELNVSSNSINPCIPTNPGWSRYLASVTLAVWIWVSTNEKIKVPKPCSDFKQDRTTDCFDKERTTISTYVLNKIKERLLI